MRALIIFVEYGDGSDTMMVKPMKTDLESHYPMMILFKQKTIRS